MQKLKRKSKLFAKALDSKPFFSKNSQIQAALLRPGSSAATFYGRRTMDNLFERSDLAFGINAFAHGT